jgi:hypothetical protein
VGAPAPDRHPHVGTMGESCPRRKRRARGLGARCAPEVFGYSTPQGVFVVTASRARVFALSLALPLSRSTSMA